MRDQTLSAWAAVNIGARDLTLSRRWSTSWSVFHSAHDQIAGRGGSFLHTNVVPKPEDDFDTIGSQELLTSNDEFRKEIYISQLWECLLPKERMVVPWGAVTSQVPETESVGGTLVADPVIEIGSNSRNRLLSPIPIYDH